MGQLRIQSKIHGDVVVEWEASNPVEVKEAEEAFGDALARGLFPAAVREGQSYQIDRFDPDEDIVVFREPLVGG